MTARVLIAVLFGVAVVTAGPAPAAAGGVKVILGGGGPVFHHGFHHFHRPTFLHRPPVASGVFSSPVIVHPHTHIIVVPRPVFIVTSPACHWTPGYWTHQWIPQSYTQELWVPGAWSPYGTWIEGHSESRTVSGGYYQQVWAAPVCVAY